MFQFFLWLHSHALKSVTRRQCTRRIMWWYREVPHVRAISVKHWPIYKDFHFQGISRHRRTWIPSCHRYVGNNALTLYTCYRYRSRFTSKKHVCHYICLSYLYRNHTPFLGSSCHQGFIPSHLWLCPSTVSGVYTSDLPGGHGKAVPFGRVSLIWLRERGKPSKTPVFWRCFHFFCDFGVTSRLCAKRMKPLFALTCFQRTMWPDLVIDGEWWIVVRCFFLLWLNYLIIWLFCLFICLLFG